MVDSNPLDPSISLLVFVMFVVHFTTVLFIAGIYLFAYKFLENSFYIPLAIGWLLNAAYIAIESLLMIMNIGSNNALALALCTAGIGILSIPFFHFSVTRVTKNKKESIAWYRPFLLGLLILSMFLSGAYWAYEGITYPDAWVFAIFTMPAAIYSSVVLISVAHRFDLNFPESEYGTRAKLLYGSWAGYAVIQYFYPFKLFLVSQKLIFFCLFLVAFVLKVIGSMALLDVLRESYNAAQAESREASVLADIGNVAAGLHHDIANPLTWIDSELSLLAQKRNTDDIVMQSIKKMRKPIQLIDSAIKFVSFIRIDPEAIARNFKRIPARESVNLAVGLYKKKNPHSTMRIVHQEDKHTYYVRANPNLLSEAFHNVLNNAYEGSARVVRIRIRRVGDVESRIEFSFINDGTALTEEELNNCFKPGWSSKDKAGIRANVGMGLFMASKIISIHRGTVEINNTEDNGVEVLVFIPATKHVAEKEEHKELNHG